MVPVVSGMPSFVLGYVSQDKKEKTRFRNIATIDIAKMALLRTFRSYCQQAPGMAVAEEDSQGNLKFLNLQAASKAAPNIIGPGTFPKVLKIADCTPNAKVLWSSDTHLNRINRL